MAPSFGKQGDPYRVAASGNQATLTIDNTGEPFRGVLKCWSSSGQVVNIRVVAGKLKSSSIAAYWPRTQARLGAGGRDHIAA